MPDPAHVAHHTRERQSSHARYGASISETMSPAGT